MNCVPFKYIFYLKCSGCVKIKFVYWLSERLLLKPISENEIVHLFSSCTKTNVLGYKENILHIWNKLLNLNSEKHQFILHPLPLTTLTLLLLMLHLLILQTHRQVTCPVSTAIPTKPHHNKRLPPPHHRWKHLWTRYSSLITTRW